MHPGGPGPGTPGVDNPSEELSPEKWGEVERFMRENSPQRMKRLEEVPEERRENLRRFMIRRFDSIQQNKEQDPSLYEIRVKRLKIEDDIFTLGLEFKDADKGDAQAIRAKLRGKVKDLVENRLAERKHWVAKAEQKLKQERDALKREEANVENMVENHVRGITEQDRWPALGGGDAMASPRPPQGDRPGQGPRFRGGDARFAAPSTMPAE